MMSEDMMKSIPVYPHTGAYASEHGELSQFRESNLANIACRSAIDLEIRRNFDGISSTASSLFSPRFLTLLADNLDRGLLHAGRGLFLRRNGTEVLHWQRHALFRCTKIKASPPANACGSGLPMQ